MIPIKDSLHSATVHYVEILILICDLKLLYFPYKVFLDEVNTSSCMGLFKEIIIDKTFEGEVLYIMQ